MVGDRPLAAVSATLNFEDELERLRAQVADLGSALEATTAGDIDAVVLGAPGAEQIYSLSTAERPYRLIVENMSEGAATVSEQGTVLFVNRRMTELMGCEAGSLVGRSVDRLVHAGDHATLQRLLEVSGETSERAEVRLAAPTLPPVTLSSACIDLDGPLVRCLIATDLTPQKEAEAVLEARVSDRTRELTLLNEQIDAFAYSVSHDLRAPLRSIDGFSQVLLEDFGPSLGAEAQEHLQRVRAAAQHMGTLIDDLLSLSRVTKADLEIGRTDLTAIVNRIVGDLWAGEPDRRVDIVVDDGLVTDADPRMADVVLRNLVGNAWKFTSHTPEPSIHVGAASPGWFVVADNGAGFDMAYAGRLFTPFQRLHTISEFPGSGVGLATVKRVLSRHGGDIRAEATPGEGATFTFTFNQSKEQP